MSDVPVQIIIAAFNTPDGAGKMMADLKEGKKEGYIGIVDAAVVVKGADGKLKITDSKRRSTKGFITGGVIGGAIGLLAGPVGWVAVGGGLIGALAGKMSGAPLKDEMKDIGSALKPNTSAIVAVIEHTWVAKMEAQLAADGARVIQESIKADIAQQLEKDGNVVYTAVSGAGAAGVARVADTKEGAEMTAIVADSDGVVIADAQVTHEKEAAPAVEAPKPAEGSAPASEAKS